MEDVPGNGTMYYPESDQDSESKLDPSEAGHGESRSNEMSEDNDDIMKLNIENWLNYLEDNGPDLTIDQINNLNEKTIIFLANEIGIPSVNSINSKGLRYLFIDALIALIDIDYLHDKLIYDYHYDNDLFKYLVDKYPTSMINELVKVTFREPTDYYDRNVLIHILGAEMRAFEAGHGHGHGAGAGAI